MNTGIRPTGFFAFAAAYVLGLFAPSGSGAQTTRPAALDIAPTAVSLRFTGAEQRDVFAELGRQAGCAFVANPPELLSAGRPRLDFEAERAPFWAVMRDICEKTSLWPGYIERRRYTLSATGRGWMDGPNVVSGAFLVVASQAVRVDSLRFSDPANRTRDLAIGLFVLPEPKLRVLRGTRHPRLEAVLDENGRSLIAGAPVPDGGLAGGGPFAWSVEIKLPSAASAKRISLLKGRCRFLIASACERWEVGDILKAAGASRTAGRRTYRVLAVHKGVEKGVEQVSVTVTVTGGRDGDAAGQIVHPACFEVLDAEGRPYALRGWARIVDRTPPEYAFHFSRLADDKGISPGEAAKFVWEITTAAEEVAVPFEFTDLPLP